MKKELRLVPINPFTPRQRDIINAILEGNNLNREIGKKLGISMVTVKTHKKGTDSTSGLRQEKIAKHKLGIYGIVEQLTGKRPYNKNLLDQLVGDVVLESSNQKSKTI